MIKLKRLGVINKHDVEKSIKKYDFIIEKYSEDDLYINVIISKNYSSKFNIEFDGYVEIECKIIKKMFYEFCIYTYPVFKELTNKIPKRYFYHIGNDGAICYAPPKRPLIENWNLDNFFNSLDSFFYNYFSIEYVGTGELIELEHGDEGIIHYERIINNTK